MSLDSDSRAAAAPEPRAVQHLDELQQVRQHYTELRNRTIARSAIATAEGILKERYRLANVREAFALLRSASQHHNIKIHTLADAVVRVPGPTHRAGAWFPGRTRSGPPTLTDLRWAGRVDNTSQSAVLDAALHRMLDVTGTTMGNVQLAENQLLRLARHTGLDRQFTEHFTFVDHSSTSCSQAARNAEQVTVLDVATAPVFDEESRRVILHAGSRACHSVPVMSEEKVLLGVISSHHDRPLTGFTQAQLDALQTAAATTGRWLSWYRRTRVFDALEHLHTTARQSR
ncbi:GAF and ANTAR domain-containing protein [Streptomyces sp. NPDC004561]